MAFAMRDEWKEEPLSITGADYVEPSAEIPLQTGQRVSHMFPRSMLEEYVLQRLTERTYSVTPLPVTAICYSHFHADHIGGARKLVGALPAAPRVIASEHTAAWMERFGSDLPRPTDILPWPDGAVDFDDVELRLRGLPRPGHSPDHAVYLLVEERIGHSADLINIDQLPFGGFAGQDPLVLFKPNLQFARGLEFDWFSGGHGNIGEKSDFDFYLNYLDELTELINEEIPRPETVPDLYLTDYIGDLGEEDRS